MNILAIDASGVAGSVAYIKEGKFVGEYYICDKLTHSQTIMPMLEHMKKILDIDLDTVDAVAVTSGPGSFTGLRIGVTAAKSLALALKVPIIGVPTLDVIARNITYTNNLICPIMDARRNQVYTSLYKWNEGNLERLMSHDACDMDEYLELLKDKDEKVIFLGDGIDCYKDKIVDVMGENACFAPEFLKLQRASVLLEIAREKYENNETTSADVFVPLYLRKSQAEREKEERERSNK